MIFTRAWESLAYSVLGFPAAIAAPKLEPQPTLVGESFGAPVGFATVARGTLYQLYVLPTAQGVGVGRALLRASMALGARRLWVDEGNHPARRLYESEGWVHSGVTDPGLYWPLSYILRYELPSGGK